MASIAAILDVRGLSHRRPCGEERMSVQTKHLWTASVGACPKTDHGEAESKLVILVLAGSGFLDVALRFSVVVEMPVMGAE